MNDDELVAVRSIRRDISKRCGGDLDRVFDYYEEVQKRIKETGRYEFVDAPLERAESKSEAPTQQVDQR